MQKSDKSRSSFTSGVDFAPENTDLLTSLGLLYLRKNNFHRSFELLGQALTYDPEYYKVRFAWSVTVVRCF